MGPETYGTLYLGSGVLADFAVQRADRVWQRSGDDAQVFAHGFRVARQVDDQRATADTRHSARKHACRSDLQTGRAHRLGDARYFVFDGVQGCLGCHIARGQTGPSGGEDEVHIRSLRQMEQRFANELLVVRNNAIVKFGILDAIGGERLANGRSAGILPLTTCGLVAYGDDRQSDHGRVNSPLLPPALWRSSTLPMLMPRSTALHM